MTDLRKVAAKPVDRLFQFRGRTQRLDPRRHLPQLLLKAADIDRAFPDLLRMFALGPRYKYPLGLRRRRRMSRRLAPEGSGDRLAVERALPRRDFGYGFVDRGVTDVSRRRVCGNS